MDQMFETSVSNPQSSSSSIAKSIDVNRSENTRLRVKKKTVQAMLEEFQRAIEDLNRSDSVDVDPGTDCEDGGDGSVVDRDADELCDLVRSRVEGKDFLKKLESVHGSIPPNIPEEGNSWDIVGDNDLWEGGIDTDPDQDDYVLVSQEDIVDGIACFMAAYLLSLKETKDLNPSQLQQALSKTFSVKKKRGKLLKAWDGSKVIYNVASWGATAIGIYQNPALVRAASTAFWTSCHIISKLF